jgi:shikimate kinase
VKRVLLTGMSGTGKSGVIQALSARGFTPVDTDDEVGTRSRVQFFKFRARCGTAGGQAPESQFARFSARQSALSPSTPAA